MRMRRVFSPLRFARSQLTVNNWIHKALTHGKYEQKVGQR